MRKSTWNRAVWTITALGLVALTPAAQAAKASKEENIGVGSGAVIGALAGGPVGFIVGAALGAKVGDTMHRKNDEIDTLNVSLDDHEVKVGDLRNDVRNLTADVKMMNVELIQAQQFAQPELVSLLQTGIAMDLSFRTDEYTLADMNGARLAELAQALSGISNIRIRLDGFADERGDADYNFNLSEKRVEYVRDQLVAAGIDGSQIDLVAHGEAEGQDDTLDSFALERRVSLTVFVDDSQAVASN